MTTIDQRAHAEVDSEVRLRRVELSDLLTRPALPPRYVLRPLLPRGKVTLLGAHGGAGKSILALTWAAHVASGRVWGDMEIAPGRALFVSLEDDAETLRYRLRRIVEGCGLSPEHVSRDLVLLDGTGGDAALAFETSEQGIRRLMLSAAFEELRDAAPGHDLIVVDNASDAFDADENSRRQVRAFVRGLAQIAREHDAAVLLLAHVDKLAAKHGAAGNSYSGSTAWHNSARSRLALVSDGGRIELRQEKLNLGREAEPIALAWTNAGLLVPVAPSDPRGAPDDCGAVLAALRAAGDAGVDVSAARTGPFTAQSVLATFIELPERLRGPRGREAFWSAVGRLMAEGRIRSETIRTAGRKSKAVLRAVECASSRGG